MEVSKKGGRKRLLLHNQELEKKISHSCGTFKKRGGNSRGGGGKRDKRMESLCYISESGEKHCQPNGI